MVNRDEAKGGLMLEEILENIFEEFEEVLDANPRNFLQLLEEAGFMIVPIDDPTNLFGLQEDD